jgi:hypothetical protein
METGMTHFHQIPATAADCPEIRPDTSLDWIEQSIIQAYVGLVFPQEFSNGKRTVTFGRFDGLEVSLTEVSIPKTEEDPPHQLELWFEGEPPYRLELRCRTSGVVIDRLGIHEFDEDEVEAAVKFVGDAARRVRHLH